ncbi:hypothetical protein NC652_028398 [Populus alba x Populus x berolinensis]|nr:hypothetical protein NC652_028398 [Populus alba x Populus x berolinensis]
MFTDGCKLVRRLLSPNKYSLNIVQEQGLDKMLSRFDSILSNLRRWTEVRRCIFLLILGSEFALTFAS